MLITVYKGDHKKYLKATANDHTVSYTKYYSIYIQSISLRKPMEILLFLPITGLRLVENKEVRVVLSLLVMMERKSPARLFNTNIKSDR